MIFKRLLILFILLLLVSTSHGQDGADSTKTTIMYDTDGLPVLKIDEKGNTLYVKYFISSWKDVCICHFKGGYDALTAYCDSLYFQRESNIDEEPNGMAMYTILFDDNLKIKDVRILKRLTYNNAKYDYDSLIKRILWSTEGKWKKEDNNNHCKWYFYFGRFKVR